MCVCVLQSATGRRLTLEIPAAHSSVELERDSVGTRKDCCALGVLQVPTEVG